MAGIYAVSGRRAVVGRHEPLAGSAFPPDTLPMRRLLPFILTAAVVGCGGAEPLPDQPITGSAADTLLAVTSWLATASSPVSLATPVTGDPELLAVRGAVAGARLIGVGEATHGTHEFQVTTHRVVQTLVREGNVSAVIIEGDLPAARDIDRYVREGIGDPVVLLSGLYGTPTNTQEHLDLIRWLRSWNATQPPERRVAFGGVDMSFAAAALDSVRRYAARVDPNGLGAFVTNAYSCFDPYDNTGAPGARPRYDSAPDSVAARCSSAARAVADTFAQRASVAGADDELLWTARYAAVIRQWEETTALQRRNPNLALAARDRSMAENALWWVARSAAGQRALLAAHDYHVSRQDSTMGQAIARSLGTAYFPIASDFDVGSFNAVAPGSPYFSAQSIPATPSGSYEEGLRTAPSASFFLDLRTAASLPKVDAWLRGPRTLRQIGTGYDPAHPGRYDQLIALPAAFDAVLFVARSTPSTLLPFVAR
jgi:erythromycin esterase